DPQAFPRLLAGLIQLNCLCPRSDEDIVVIFDGFKAVSTPEIKPSGSQRASQMFANKRTAPNSAWRTYSVLGSVPLIVKPYGCNLRKLVGRRLPSSIDNLLPCHPWRVVA